MSGQAPRVLGREEVPPELAHRTEGLAPGVYVTSHRRRIYVLVSAGEQRTAGYELRLTGSPADQFARGRLEAELLGPPPGAMVAQVLTYPFLVVDAGEGPVLLREASLLRGKARQPLPINFWGEMSS